MASKIRYQITTDTQLEAALDRIAELISFKKGTLEHAELTLLLVAVTAHGDRLKDQRRRTSETVH